MKHTLTALVLGVALLLASGGSGYAQDFNKGLDAYKRGDFATALRELKPLAEQGDAEAQLSLGIIYDLGLGVRNEGDTAKFSVNSKAKADGLRYALYVYELDNGKRTNYDIAQEILKKHKGAGILESFVGEKDVVQSRIGRYKRTAHQYLQNVCEGRLM